MRASAQRVRQSHPLPSLLSRRMQLADGATTTLHVASFPLDRVAVRVARLSEPEPLVRWCRRSGMAHAIVGGFFLRPGNAPLGELRTRDRPGSAPRTAASCSAVARRGDTVISL